MNWNYFVYIEDRANEKIRYKYGIGDEEEPCSTGFNLDLTIWTLNFKVKIHSNHSYTGVGKVDSQCHCDIF